MTASETPLQMVRRHIAEGEAHIAKQVLVIETLRTLNSSAEGSGALLTAAEALLDQFRSTQTSHIDHLRMIQQDQGDGLRDEHGNLVFNVDGKPM